jgi:excisionase family DNA binding protein
MEKVYTVIQTAEALNVGKKAVYELISQNKLKAVRVGRSLRIPQECINEYMNLTAFNLKTQRELELEIEIQELRQEIVKKDKFIDTVKINLIKLSETG